MIETIVNNMLSKTRQMQDIILTDIEDVKQARHEKLLEKNEVKKELMELIASQKLELNKELASAYQQGFDINIYRDIVNNLETELYKLYELNSKLGSIVLPVRQMYKEIVDELTAHNGGNIYDIRA